MAGYSGEIVVLGAEPHRPYTRPPLSKAALADGPSHEAVALRVRSEAADVVWRLGTPAVGADLAAGLVVPEHGEPIGFGALVVCTGLRPGGCGCRGRPPGGSCCAPWTTPSRCVPCCAPAPRSSWSGPGSSAARWPPPRAPWAAR